MGMPAENRPRSSGPVIAIVLVAAVIFVGLVLSVAIGAFVLLRTETRRTEMARVEAERARAVAQKQYAEAMAAAEEAMAAARAARAQAGRKEIAIELDADGGVHVDGRTLEVAELKNMLRDSAADSEDPPTAVLRVDPECAFRHVAAVQAACEEAGLPDVQIAVAPHADTDNGGLIPPDS